MPTVDHTQLHRTAKYFMDSGRSETHEEAMGLLQRFGLSIRVGSEVGYSLHHQIALLTLINIARRTLLAGVEVVGLPDAPALTLFEPGIDLKSAVSSLGGIVSSHANTRWPSALIGTIDTKWEERSSWRVTWAGWRGGVIPSVHAKRLSEIGSNALAPALAGATCAAEVFAFHAKDHPMAGRRTSGLSLWAPGRNWIDDDRTEPEIGYLPSKLWIIGLGNLGQAFAWLLACLPYEDRRSLQLMLQDFDQITESNDSTSLLSSLKLVGQKKSRVVCAWLETLGFSPAIEERRFGEWTRRAPHEPGVAFCGVDNALARTSLGSAGFDLVVEAGLGGGPSGFRNFSMHTFPASRRPERLWSSDIQLTSHDVLAMPAYASLEKSGLDKCGLAQLASRTVGVPFVGLIASALAIAELMRRLHGGDGHEIVSGSVSSLDDVEAASMTFTPYAHGHLPVAHDLER